MKACSDVADAFIVFAEVPDPRRGQGKMYPLAPILLFTVLAMLSGAVSYRCG